MHGADLVIRLVSQSRIHWQMRAWIARASTSYRKNPSKLMSKGASLIRWGIVHAIDKMTTHGRLSFFTMA